MAVTALEHDLTMVTRNVNDFSNFEVQTLIRGTVRSRPTLKPPTI
jgi:predicted nucleic acid-binding protein